MTKVIGELEKLSTGTSKKDREAKQKLIRYYRKNRKRLRYVALLKRGLPIGSGAIESVLGNVLRQRMKLSGQRWIALWIRS